MRRLLTGAAALVTGLLVPGGAAGSGSATTSPSGGLYISTLPSGADVYVDGTYVGRSPVYVDALGAGRHGLTMTKAGWALRETDVVVPAGAVAFESDRLAAASAGDVDGAILVRGVGTGARIELDGLAVTARGSFAASAGAHRLTIVDGAARTTRGITVFPGTTTDVLARDAAAPAARGGAAVVAALDEWLPGAALTMAGKKFAFRYESHAVTGRVGEPAMAVDGESLSYAGAPELIGGRLYLPLALLERLSGDVVRAEPKK